MVFRKALPGDLRRVQAMFDGIVAQMEKDGVAIWDEVYPNAFFPSDIEKERLYVLTEGDEIVSAFALLPGAGEDGEEGAQGIRWEKENARALYLERFGVNVRYRRRGIATLTLEKAALVAREQGAETLRLLVAEINEPARRLYQKSGFEQAPGETLLFIDETLSLREVGMERRLSSCV